MYPLRRNAQYGNHFSEGIHRRSLDHRSARDLYGFRFEAHGMSCFDQQTRQCYQNVIDDAAPKNK